LGRSLCLSYRLSDGEITWLGLKHIHIAYSSKINNIPRLVSPRQTFFAFTNFSYDIPFVRNWMESIVVIALFFAMIPLLSHPQCISDGRSNGKVN
jgi:hypothetical protein